MRARRFRLALIFAGIVAAASLYWMLHQTERVANLETLESAPVEAQISAPQTPRLNPPTRAQIAEELSKKRDTRTLLSVEAFSSRLKEAKREELEDCAKDAQNALPLAVRAACRVGVSKLTQ